MLSLAGSPKTRRWIACGAASVAVLAAVGVGATASAHPSGVIISSSAVTASDGQTYRISNHITRTVWTELARHQRRHEWLLVWAGDESTNMPLPWEPAPEPTTDPDFLAVVDATRTSPTYGQVVNTVTIDSVLGNEPHHMQYQWHKGDKVYAGGLLSDITYVFDVKHLPEVRLHGVVPATATPCGSVPDAYQVLADGTAYATYMGGPDVAGPCQYTNGQVREGNGFGGSPGEVVHISPNGDVLSEAPAAAATSDGPTCGNIPALPAPSCANPHGIALREDLDRLLVGDFAEARNLIGGQLPSVMIVRDTVRIFDISDRDRPRLASVSRLPNGPRLEPDDSLKERWGPMETALTNRPQNRGGFVSTLNGVLYYAPDITAANPAWRVVYDDYHAFKTLFPIDTPTSAIDGGSWIQVSPNDRYLYRLVLGGGWGSPGDFETGMLLVLDIQALVGARTRVQCAIDTVDEVAAGGAEADCPRLVSVVPIRDATTGGPHWAVMDTFHKGPTGFYRELDRVDRIATSNYFVAPTGTGGDHRICMYQVSASGQVSPDTSFRDEYDGTPCLNFNRLRWPHGERGHARPHGLLFAVADADLR